MRLQVISFLRAFLHRIGLQDFLVTSALNRLSLIMSPLKHMLMLCRLLNLTKHLSSIAHVMSHFQREVGGTVDKLTILTGAPL